MGRNIKHVNDLLQNIAAGINKLNPNTKIGCIEVALYEGTLHLGNYPETDTPLLVANLQTVLDYIAEDVYWNEDADWSDARVAKVSVI